MVQCDGVCKNGARCSKQAVIQGKCMIHYTVHTGQSKHNKFLANKEPAGNWQPIYNHGKKWRNTDGG